MKPPFVRRFILPDEPLGEVQGVFYDVLFTAHGLMLYAVRDGLTVCLPWVHAPLFGAQLGSIAPLVKLLARYIRPESLLWMRAQAVAESALPFREMLFHMRADGHWVKPAQRRNYGAVRPLNRDVTDVIAELHTHPDGCRGFSAMDDADDTGFNVQLVVEAITSDQPHVCARISVYGHLIPIAASLIADLPDGWIDDFDDALISEAEVQCDVTNS